MKRTKEELFNKFMTGSKPTQQDFHDLIIALHDLEELEHHKIETAPHVYGNRFEWRYNEVTDSLDLVVKS